MSAINISFDQGDPLLDWLGLTAAFEAGHKRPKAEISDTFLYREKDTLLSRAAWIDGLGITVKAATIFPDNPSSVSIIKNIIILNCIIFSSLSPLV